MEMISSKDYAKEIKKYDYNKLIDERKKLLSSIEYLEKIDFTKNEDNKNVYLAKLGYLVECIKEIQKKSGILEKEEEKDTLHDGDIVKLNDKEYKVEIVIDRVTGVKKNEDTIEIHVLAKHADDYKFVKRVYKRYKSKLN